MNSWSETSQGQTEATVLEEELTKPFKHLTTQAVQTVTVLASIEYSKVVRWGRGLSLVLSCYSVLNCSADATHKVRHNNISTNNDMNTQRDSCRNVQATSAIGSSQKCSGVNILYPNTSQLPYSCM